MKIYNCSVTDNILHARIEELERERESFCMDYRIKCDEETKLLHGKLEKLENQLETERLRLAACGVVALANTPDSAAKARQMLPEYRSASCDDIARIVDSEISIRKQRDDLLAALINHQDQTRPIQQTIDVIARVNELK